MRLVIRKTQIGQAVEDAVEPDTRLEPRERCAATTYYTENMVLPSPRRLDVVWGDSRAAD